MVQCNYRVMPIIMILLSLLLVSISVPSCQANYANWGILNEGSSFHNGTHIQMPYADVRINITYTSSRIDISLGSEFHIKTNITQNATLAYVYPSPAGTNYELTDDSYMHIYGNGTLINYTVIEYHNFTESVFTENFLVNHPYVITYVNFAVFNIELAANTTMVLSTVSGASFSANLEQFDYHYIVGSARTFEDHTLERVHFQVVEEQKFLRKSFGPNESLTVSEHSSLNTIITDAIWDFNITEFSEDVLHLGAEVRAPVMDTLNTIGTTLLIVFIIFLVYQFGYKKSKEFN